MELSSSENGEEKFKKIEVLGEGTYGKVYKVSKNGKEFAIKRFFNTRKSDKVYGVVTLRELDFLARLRSPFINCAEQFIYGNPFDEPLLPVKGVRDDKVFIVLPLANYSGAALAGREKNAEREIIDTSRVTYVQIKRMMYQLLQGLYYMHSNKICHRDIKPGNFLVFKKGEKEMIAKWTDFGMCKHLTSQDKNSTYVSTSIYKPPELLLKNDDYGLPFDIWSLGCLFYEIIARDDLFTGGNDIEVLRDIFRVRGTPSKKGYVEIAGNDPLIKYSSLKKRRKRKWSTVLTFEEDEIELFEKDIGKVEKDMLPNFGTFDQFFDLLDVMLKVIPSERATAWDCLNHEFFDDIPEGENGSYDQWFDLVKQKEIIIEYHILEKIGHDQTRIHGIEIIKNIKINFVKNGYRIAFLGLDIYDRCLLILRRIFAEVQNVKESDIKWPRQGSKIAIRLPRKTDKLFNYRVLAACSCYMACKYFIDEDTPRLNKIFPINKFKVKDIEAMEKLILEELIKYRIYRTTVYDLLRKKCVPETLFYLLMENNDVYGHTIDVVAEIYAKQTEKKTEKKNREKNREKNFQKEK